MNSVPDGATKFRPEWSGDFPVVGVNAVNRGCKGQPGTERFCPSYLSPIPVEIRINFHYRDQEMCLSYPIVPYIRVLYSSAVADRALFWSPWVFHEPSSRVQNCLTCGKCLTKLGNRESLRSRDPSDLNEWEQIRWERINKNGPNQENIFSFDSTETNPRNSLLNLLSARTVGTTWFYIHIKVANWMVTSLKDDDVTNHNDADDGHGVANSIDRRSRSYV